MKKIISLILTFLLLASSCVIAFGEKPNYSNLEILCGTSQEFPIIKKEEPKISLFSSNDKLEKIITDAWDNLQGWDLEINDGQLFDISEFNLSLEEFGTKYYNILNKNPLYFYVESWVYVDDGNNNIIYFAPTYKIKDKNYIDETLEKIREATEGILLEIDDGMSDFEKVMTVHNHMVFEYSYDQNYEIYDIRIMITKTGVCQAYSMAFMHLMNELDIDCTFVSSPYIRDANNNIIGGMNHGWNLVKVDGEWYHIDLTWDDPIGLYSTLLVNSFALLSDYKIQNPGNGKSPHFDYDTGGYKANSTKYDDSSWHDTYSAVVTVNDHDYWVENGKIMSYDDNGSEVVIADNLDGGDNFWHLASGLGYNNSNYTGLAERNGLLYYNTDTEIKTYDPSTKIHKTILTGYFYGLFIHQNTLHYSKYDLKTGTFVEGDPIKLGNIRYGKPRHEKGKIVTRLYKENDDTVCIYSYGSGDVQMEKINKKGVSKVTFDEQKKQTVFYWNEQMQPLKNKEVVNK